MIWRIHCAMWGALTALCVLAPVQAQGAGPVAGEGAGTTAAANSIGMRMVLVPAGEFVMGNSHVPAEEVEVFKPYSIDLKPEVFNDEYPRHRVRITRPFYLGSYHVTVGQFRQFVDDTGYKTDAERDEKKGAFGFDPSIGKIVFKAEYSWRNVGFQKTDDHPVVNVSWNDAVAFCQWLSRREGQTYRLPTEAEWEYACRAGTTTRYFNGDDPENLIQVGNLADASARAQFPNLKTINASDGYVFTSPVGKFSPNALGLYDMYGNAWQWCADWYAADYYGKSLTDDPTGPESGAFRALRGGSWMARPYNARSAYRGWITPTFRYDFVGFRVARTP